MRAQTLFGIPFLFALTALPACGATRVLAGPSDVMAVDPCIDLTEDDECDDRIDYVRKAFDSTVQVYVSNYSKKDGVAYGSGTGSVIDAHGGVMTAYHVVKEAKLIVANLRRLKPDATGRDTVRGIPMYVAAFNEELDVALLKPSVSGEKFPAPFAIRQEPVQVGERMWHFGNVSFWAHGLIRETGVTFDGTPGMIKAGFPCRHGDSGGPLVDQHGRLAGVLLKKDLPNIEGRGRTFFMPIATALDALGHD